MNLKVNQYLKEDLKIVTKQVEIFYTCLKQFF